MAFSEFKEYFEIINSNRKLTMLSIVQAMLEVSTILILGWIIRNEIQEIDIEKATWVLPDHSAILIFPMIYVIYAIVTKVTLNSVQSLGMRYADQQFCTLISSQLKDVKENGVEFYQSKIISDTDRYCNGVILPIFVIVQKIISLFILGSLLVFLVSIYTIFCMILMLIMFLSVYYFIRKKNIQNGLLLDSLISERYQIVAKQVNYFGEASTLGLKTFLLIPFFDNSRKISSTLSNITFNTQIIRIVLECVLFLVVGILLTSQVALNFFGADIIPVSLAALRIFPNIQSIFSNLSFIQAHKSVMKKRNFTQTRTENISNINNQQVIRSEKPVVKIKLHATSVRLGSTLINYEDHCFEVGKIYAIIGKSGVGKTTFLEIISGLIRVEEGYVEYFSSNNEGFNNKPKMHYLPQKFFQENDNVWEVITRFSSRNLKLADYENIFCRLGLVEIYDKLIIGDFINFNSLSAGQQQRIGLMRLLISDCSVRLLDEPTSALDEVSTNLVMDQLNATKSHTITIIVTHDDFVASKCDEIIKVN